MVELGVHEFDDFASHHGLQFLHLVVCLQIGMNLTSAKSKKNQK